MNLKSMVCKAHGVILVTVFGAVSVNAATLTQQETWALVSGPDDPPVQESRLLDLFDPSRGTLTQVDWAVDAGMQARFFTQPSSFPITYSLGAGIGCGITLPLGLFGCDLGPTPTQGDTRSGRTLPISGPVGIDETITLAFLNSVSFTDPALLAAFTGAIPMRLDLQVDTFAQAESCIPDPFNPGSEICTPIPVGFSGVYTGELSVTYTFDPVPVPAALWLFCSGLLGLIGIARRRQA